MRCSGIKAYGVTAWKPACHTWRVHFFPRLYLQALIKSSRKDFDLAGTSKRPRLLIQEEDEVDSSKNSGLFEDIYPGLLSPGPKKKRKRTKKKEGRINSWDNPSSSHGTRCIGCRDYVGREHSEHQVYRTRLNLALVVCFDFSGNTHETMLRMRAREKADVSFCSSAPPAPRQSLSLYCWACFYGQQKRSHINVVRVRRKPTPREMQFSVASTTLRSYTEEGITALGRGA